MCYFDLTKKNLYSILIIYRLEQNRGPSSPQAGPSGLQSNQNRSLNAHDLQLDCLSSDTEEEEVTVVKICRRRKDQAVRELNGTVIDGQETKVDNANQASRELNGTVIDGQEIKVNNTAGADQATQELNGTVTDSQEIKVDNTRKRKSSEILPEIEQENQKLKEAQTCKICLVKEIRVVFLPCGHLMSCVNCTRKLKKCAVCRQFIHKKQKTYRS